MTYWKKRLLEQEKNILDKGISATENELVRLYQRAARENEKELKSLFYELSKNGEVKINDLYRYNRYWEVQNSINRRLTSLGQQEIKILNKDLLGMYATVNEYFNKNPKFLARTVSNGEAERVISMAANPTNMHEPIFGINAKEVVDRIWCADGRSWSDRVWNNMEKLQASLEKGISDVVVRGQGADEVVTTIMQEQTGLTIEDANTEAFEKAFSRTRALVSTELAHVYNQAAIQRYIDAGCVGYEVLVAPENTAKAIAYNATHKDKKFYPCEDCESLKGKVFLFNDMEEGVNCPPIHPNCRCTIVPVVGR